jgi:uridine kinase
LDARNFILIAYQTKQYADIIIPRGVDNEVSIAKQLDHERGGRERVVI